MIPMQNTSPVELAWVVICLVGMVAALVLTGSWLGRWRALRRMKINGETRLIAWDRLRNKIGYSVTFGAGLWLGLLATLAPARAEEANGPVEAWAYESMMSGILPVFFILIGVPAVLMIWTIVSDWHLERVIARKAEAPPESGKQVHLEGKVTITRDEEDE
jgi:uncharacterized membrane protein